MVPRNSSRRWRRAGWAFLVAVAIFALVSFFVLPPMVKSQLEKRLSAASGRGVTVERVRLNPFALSLTLENFDVREKSGNASFLGWSKLYVNFDLLASIGGQWVIRAVALDGFHASVAINPDGSFNFSDLLALVEKSGGGKSPAVPSKPSRPVRVARLAVTSSKVEFTDRSRAKPFRTTVGPLTFSLLNFTTSPDRKAPYGFDAVTEAGEKFSWRGVLGANPLGSTGELKIENIFLPKYAPYYAHFLQAEISDGRLSLRGKYELELGGQERVMKLSDGGVRLQDFKLLEHGATEPTLILPAVEVTGVAADATTLSASVSSVIVNGGKMRVRREKEGALNLLALLPAQAASTGSGPTNASIKRAPTFTLGVFDLKAFQIEFQDLAAPRPAQLALRQLQATAKNVTLAEGAVMPMEMTFDWTPKGTVKLSGTAALSPVAADLKVQVNGFEVLPLSPYLEQFAQVRLTQGSVSAAVNAHISLPPGKPAVATLAGDVSADKFALVDAAKNEELAGWAALALRRLNVTTAPQLKVELGEISLASPYARIVVGADHALNLATILLSSRSDRPATVATPAPALLPKIAIEKVTIDAGDFSFSDRGIEPAVHMAVTQFSGTLSGLSSEEAGRAEVDLRASVDGSGPVAIAGRLDILRARKFADLKMEVRNVDLQPLSPYSGRFAGYELARGKLLLDVKLALDDKKIDASNVITLNQFTFGAATDSPDAVKLPVRLGVALLKDLDGKILIDVPVQGNLDDPNFRVGKVVWRVVGNLLTKAAVSPFSLLGSMFGGGGDELAFQEFSPGTADLLPAEARKLETMVKALTNRPGLNVDLEGSFDRAADGFALKRLKVAEQVRRAIWEGKHATDPNIPPPEELAISAEENSAMVKKLFDAKFPPGTTFGTPLPQAPAVATVPTPAPGLVKRMWNTVTLKTLRAERAVKNENERRATEHENEVKAAIAAGLPLEAMTGRLAEAMEISDDDLRVLAQARARQVRDYFVEQGKVSSERIFLGQASADASKLEKGPRVFLNLQ